MMSKRIGSFLSIARGAGAALAVAAACVALRGEPARACGWDGPSVEDLTTFDPRIVADEDSEGLYYNPYQSGYGEPCGSCATQAMLADWQGYLKDNVTAADWESILLRASLGDLLAMADKLAGKRVAIPNGYEHSSLWTNVGARPQLRAALALVTLARQVERIAGGSADASGLAALDKPVASPDLLAVAKAGLRATRDPFLAQRYAFQIVKILFYQRAFGELIDYARRSAPVLATPSIDLSWRARYYLAGALMRDGNRARANLELARVHAGYSMLAGVAANDFRPMEETDWRESLRLAGTPKDKAELWRLVGLTHDGLVAMKEIVKLDPRSPLLAMLMVRELERAESRTSGAYGIAADPKAEERQRAELAALEPLAASLAGTAGADRPWLMSLMAGHMAAKRGELVVARGRLLQALAAQPHNVRVKNQVKASLAMALVLDGTKVGSRAGGKPGLNSVLTAERGNAIADAMSEIEPGFARLGRVRGEVRGQLATAYATAGRWIEAELLQPGMLDGKQATASKWHDASFLKAMIARSGQSVTSFDKFLLQDSYSRPQLEQELALHYLTTGAFAEAARVFSKGVAASTRLGTDPFVIHILDCHDCDHEQYAEAPWTHRSLVERMVELERTANSKGEPAAAAALALGNALYNLTWYGNARVVLQDSHQAISAPRAAERWYKRAYELSHSRELRAKAAFLAAKAELGTLLTAAEESAAVDAEERVGMSDLPIPKTWFPVVETFADTRYYREVLRECSNFRAWTQRTH
jgi:hypothetical protein